MDNFILDKAWFQKAGLERGRAMRASLKMPGVLEENKLKGAIP